MSVAQHTVKSGARRVSRQYGYPFTGYVGSMSRDNVPLGAFTADTRDWDIGPEEGQAMLRLGYALAGETVYARTGLLENLWASTVGFGGNPMSRHVLGLQYPYADTGGPIATTTLPTTLYTDDAELYGYGQVLAPDNGNNLKVIGQDFDATTYPAVTASTEFAFKMVPIPCLPRGGYAVGESVSTGVLYNRCVNKLHRRLLCGGSRRMIDAGGWLLVPNFHGTPMKWNRRFKKASGNATEKVRISPWGNPPPLHRPTLSTDYASAADLTVSVGTSDAVFYEGDVRYLSVMFQHKDGSFSRPYLCNATVRGASAGRMDGAITVTGAGGTAITGTATYKNILYRNVPTGGYDVARRILLGSDWVNIGTGAWGTGLGPPGGNATTGGPTLSSIDPTGLKVIGIINNNTDTTFLDTTRSSNALLPDTAVNWFHILPPPSRYVFEMERRVGVGYSKNVNPVAMFVAPIGAKAGAWGAFNAGDEAAALYLATAQCIRLFRSTTGVMTLHAQQGDVNANTNYSDNVTLSGTPMDGISLTALRNRFITSAIPGQGAIAEAGGAWVAELAPGVDGNILTDNLMPTVFQVGSGNVTSTAGGISTGAASPNDFSDVAIGHRARIVSGATTGVIPATCYVIKKTSNTAVVLGDADGKAIASTADNGAAIVFEFWSDMGDDATNTNASWGKGNMRCFGPALPGVLAFNGRYIDALGVNKQRVWYSSAAPGQAAMAAQTFINNPSCFSGPPVTAGVFVGSAPLNKNNILCYSKSIYMLENRKSGSSGDDQDYHIYPINLHRGCTQFGTVAHGDGWVTYRTIEGYMVTDGEREVVISNALYDPATGYGVIGGMAVNYADQDDALNQTAHCCVSGGALHATFKSSAAADVFMMVRSIYRFSTGIEAAGLNEVLRGGTQPFAWSAPFKQACNAMGAMADGTLYAAHDAAGGDVVPANDGTLWKLDALVSHTGSGSSVSAGMDEPVRWSGFGDLTGSTKTLTLTTSAYARVPVGAWITGTGITGQALVIAKSADGVTVTLAGTIADASQSNLTIYGSEISYSVGSASGFLYLATDLVGDPKNTKRMLSFSLRYAAAAAVANALQVVKYNGFGRTSSALFQFKGTAAYLSRNLPTTGYAKASSRARAPVQSHEFLVTANSPSVGYRPEIWGLDVDYEVLDTPR